MTDAPVPLLARLWLAIACAFRVLFNPVLAGRVRALLAAPGSGDSGETETETAQRSEAVAPAKAPSPPSRTTDDGALGLLALLQREGRLVDFLTQDIDAFGDADVGAAVRVVHSGCRKALLAHFELSHVRSEKEGASMTVPEGFDGRSIKLTGDVRGTAPYRGVLRHAGWRADAVRLPSLVEGYDAAIIAPAEVEL